MGILKKPSKVPKSSQIRAPNLFSKRRIWIWETIFRTKVCQNSNVWDKQGSHKLCIVTYRRMALTSSLHALRLSPRYSHLKQALRKYEKLTVAQATKSSEFTFPVNSSTSPLIYANASCFHRLDRFLHFRKYAKAVGGNNYTSYIPNRIVILNMRLAEWIGMNSMSHAVVYSQGYTVIWWISSWRHLDTVFWGVSKARIRTCFPQMQSAEGTACFWQWRSKPGDQRFRSQVVDVHSDSTQAGEERCPEAEMPYY